MWLGTASCMAEVVTYVLLSGSHAELLLVPCWLVGTAAHGSEMQLKARVTCCSFCCFHELQGLVGLTMADWLHALLAAAPPA